MHLPLSKYATAKDEPQPQRKGGGRLASFLITKRTAKGHHTSFLSYLYHGLEIHDASMDPLYGIRCQAVVGRHDGLLAKLFPWAAGGETGGEKCSFVDG